MKYSEYEQTCLNNLRLAESKIKKTNNFIVDIGSSYNSWFLDFPYSGILIEMELEKIMKMPTTPFYKKIHKKVTTSNICNILKENNTPKDFYMMNLDIDGIDLWILHTVLAEYQPKIIITEINEKIPFPIKFSIKNDPNFYWNWCHLFGYSIACLEDIMKMYNYSIDSLHMNNIVLIKNEKTDKPNINEIGKIYIEGYLQNKIFPPPTYNDDVKNLHECKTKEDVAIKWREYFLNNPNPNNGKDQSENIDNYVINDEYEKYLEKFLKNRESVII